MSGLTRRNLLSADLRFRGFLRGVRCVFLEEYELFHNNPSANSREFAVFLFEDFGKCHFIES
jgi:hypothetical protein